MKKIIIMFIITLIISSVIIFYNPNKKYLGVYKDNITIEYKINECSWLFELKNNNLKLTENKKENVELWKFEINNEGNEELTFKCIKDEETIYIIYYEFEIKKNKIIWKQGEGKGLFDYPNPY